jgi:hypothetical protein
MTPRRLSFIAPRAGVFAALSALAFAMPATAEDIQVPLDQVRIVAFPSPVKTVFVGNPVVADITVIDPTHVFLMGKNFGTTNLIALDAKGHETLNEQIMVIERPGSAVTVQRGPARSTMNCTSTHCEAVPTPGDDKMPYDTVTGQIDKRESVNARAAGEK